MQPLRIMKFTEETLRLAGTSCMAMRARRFSRLVTRRYERALRETGLTPSQFNLLGAIELKHPVSPAALARMLDLDKSTLSRSLRPLITEGLLVPKITGEGRRSLSLTPIGRKLLLRAIPAWQKAQAEMISRLGAEASKKLDKMISAVGEL